MHNHKRCPLFLAGHASGKLKGNLHIITPDGTPMANSMLSMLHMVGLDDVKSFGDSTGPSISTARPNRVTKTFATSRNRCVWPWRCTAAQLDTPVADAARDGNRALVRAALGKGADVNAAQGDGMTALHWAAMNGDAELTQSPRARWSQA